MRISITGRNIEVSDYLKSVAEKQVNKLNKYLDDNAEVHVILSVERNRHIVEVTIPCEFGVVRAEDVTGDMYASINGVLKKIERRLIKYRSRWDRKHRGNDRYEEEALVFIDAVEEEQERAVVKTKRFDLKPMVVDEAIMQLELLGHSFYVFSNAETGDTNVLYKRNDGDYGLIETK